MYEAALKNLKTTQGDGSLDNIELKLGNKSKAINLKIPVMYIISENQGGDSICGRNIHYGLTARQISRMCDAGPDELKKLRIGACNRQRMHHVMENVNINSTTYLHSIYQAPHWIAQFTLDHGGNLEGIFTAACPPEALHALESGIYLHILNPFTTTGTYMSQAMTSKSM